MSDSPSALPPPHLAPPYGTAPARELVSTEPVIAQPDAWLVPRSWALVVALLAAAGLLSTALLWQKLESIQEELARRTTDSSAQAIEARTLAREAQDNTHDLLARLAQQETRLSEVSLQRAQLEELMQSLSRSRDENLVVDVESDLRLAQQQALLSGSAEPLLAALKSADMRLTRAAQPRLNPLQRAVTRDIDRIKRASVTDVPALMLKLDELARLIDELPVANDMATNALARAQPETDTAPQRDAPATGKSWLPGVDLTALQAWSGRVAGNVWAEASQLLRVSRIDQPEAALMAPEQSFFLRENLKLRLLNARLALLSRQTDAARADLTNARVWMGKYFDPAARKTQAAIQLLAQVQSQLKTTDLPRIDETLAALATAAAGR
ncbi:uroporphyrin-3 C-methyltransferase [Polaromonas sp. CG_9.5]|uniref:uroporphyrinogen-III C-methyltransferase n=1 Tax=Polaromonas sp. CG_9.5 TaxID=3071705 RepID=UPI002E0C093E|nr:uroporphyrin-3 C-methyltransferase [Polaromonas sp. CG_9.5]